MSVPKTAACKFIEAKTITIPGPDKFPEVNPTEVKPVKSNEEGFGDLEDQRYTEDEDKEASSRELMRKAAAMSGKHGCDCGKVHPDMTHEKWEALQEKKAYPIDMLRVLKSLGAGALGGAVGGAAGFTAGDYLGRVVSDNPEPMNLWGVEPGNVGTVPGGAAFGALAGGALTSFGDIGAQIQEAQEREREEAGEKQAQGSRVTEYSPERAKGNVALKQQLLKETGGQAGSGGVGGAAVGKLNRLPITISRNDAISAGILQGRTINPATWFSSPARNAPAQMTIQPGHTDYAKALPYRKKSSAADIGAYLAKQAFSPQSMGKWLDEPRSLNPDEEEQIRRGKKQWRGTKSHNPEISELMRSPWASAAEGALGGGLMMGGAGALYGGLRGASRGDAGTGALLGGGILGALGAGAGGFSEYWDQSQLNDNLEALMRQQSEERATISDLERNLMEEEERYRQEVLRGSKQASEYGKPKPSSATAAQKKTIADVNKPQPGATVGPRPGYPAGYGKAEAKAFPANHPGRSHLTPKKTSVAKPRGIKPDAWAAPSPSDKSPRVNSPPIMAKKTGRIKRSEEYYGDEPAQQWAADMGNDVGSVLGQHGVTPDDLGNMVGGTARGAGIGAAAVPGAIGALGGGMYGLLAPGKNREGEQRSRLVEALKRSLLYGTLGAGAGLAGLAGGFGGGIAGLGNELQQIGEREYNALPPEYDPEPENFISKTSATRAHRAYRAAEERLRSFEQSS